MAGYISEFQVVGGVTKEFIEIAVPAGTDVSSYTVLVYASNGTVAHTYSLGTLQSTVSGEDVFVINQSTPGFADILSGQAIALVDDTGTVDQFVSFGGTTVYAVSGPAAGETSINAGPIGVGKSLQSDDGGNSYYTQSAPNSGTVPCYAPGTMIDTPGGPRPVETLRRGDLVTTMDHGAQPIRWTRSALQPLGTVEPDAKPVLVRAGALAINLPLRDLIISPQHRIFVGGANQLLAVFASEALAPAKALTSLPGIRHMAGKKEITWIHFACDRHEIVRANGCWSESLLIGQMVQQGLTVQDRWELDAVLPSATDPDYLNGPPARPCLKVGEAMHMISRLPKSGLIAA